MKIFRIAILSFFALVILGALFLASGLGKRLVREGLVYALKRSGLHVEVGSLSGRVPQQMHLKDVKIEDVGGMDISIDEVEIELALLPLLGGEIRVRQLEADQVRFVKRADAKTGENSPFPLARLPMAVSLRSIRVTHIHWPELPELELRGEGALRRRGKSAYFDLDIKRYDVPGATLNLIATRNRFGKFDASIEFDTPTLAALSPWIQEEAAEGTLHVEASLRGTAEEFTGAIKGRFYGEQTGVLPLQLFNREWAFKTRIQKKRLQPVHFERLLASTQGLRVQGWADLDKKNSFAKAHLEVRGDLSAFSFPVQASGTVFATGHIVRGQKGFQTALRWKSPALAIDGVQLEQASGLINGLLGEKSFLGQLEAEANYLQEPWSLKTPVTYRIHNPLIFENIQLDSTRLSASGHMALRPDRVWVGTIALNNADLHLIQRYDSQIAASGFASGKCFFEASDSEKPVQQIKANLQCTDARLGPLYAYQIKASGEWSSAEPGNLFLELNAAQWGKIKLDSAVFETFSGVEKHPVRITLDGSLRSPLDLRLDGFWQRLGNGFLVSLQSAEGTIFSHPVFLLEPSNIEWGPSKMGWDRFALSFGDGAIDLSFRKEADQTDAELELQKIPIDILSINPLHVNVAGDFNAKGALKQRGEKTDADWNISLQNGRIESEGAEPLTASGAMEGALHGDRLQLKTAFDVRGKELFALNLEVPIHVVGLPPHISVPDEGPVSGSLVAKGQIEDLLDFFNLGMHRLEGDFISDLKVSGSLAHPHLEGSCSMIDGYYQNYLTGTEITHITGTFKGENDRLVLPSLTGQDYEKKGELTASGDLLFLWQRRFPFHFDVDFSRLNLVQIDLVDAEAKGHVSIDGTLRSAKASGQVTFVESDITIPDKIPRSYPDLKVVYKNGPKPVEPSANWKPAYPLELDLKIEAPEGIYIGGRGLTSEWKGDFSIGGIYAEPAASGKLDLINGEFVFAGRRFKLIEGEISLRGNEYKLPIIDISGNTSEKGVSITARLRGPLNHPQITFQSVPPLPLSGILSYLLFGKDLSEVNGLQALQLAGTVASVAGEGPDIMEITRKSLGVDRLQIVMTPSTSGEGQETVALQVGKVLTPGLVVTVRQGADDSSPNLGIEIDLTHGFTFEGESQQQPEQGKFSLKWNLNY